MTPKEFVKKWSAIQLKEQTTAQTHFNDVCVLVGHDDPLTHDPDGERFTFEMRTDEGGGKHGRADVWYKGKFIWEYKGPGRDLDKAYQQLLRYREALDNPPLLITSDTNDIFIHTNFTGTVKEIHKVTLETILDGDGFDLLKRAFFDPDSFKPAVTKDQVTEATAATFLHVADALKKYDPSADPEKIAHFLVQLLFTIFAEDMELLPNNIFTQLIQRHHNNPKLFDQSLRSLFKTMRDGGLFGIESIPHFNGHLFDYDYIPNVPSDLTEPLLNAAAQNWANINPTIFGTLFERIIDTDKRAQLGAHYTSIDDIMLIVEPVLMQPLREQWETTRTAARRLIRDGKLEEAHTLVSDCATMIANTTVLDPACGSGNFLYVALQQLMGLQKEVIAYAERNGLAPIPLTVSPHQLYGIEINPYAHELAQITVWIGYIQWRFENGLRHIEEPILRPLNQIHRKDAILAYDDKGNPVEPEWPAADVIIGNPPFLGGQKLLRELGESYVTQLRTLYGQLPNSADLVAYWFYRSAQQIDQKTAERVGLIATQTIRGENSRPVLEYVQSIGDIFMAWKDRPWVLDGASVRVSLVGFDGGHETVKQLDGQIVPAINANLSSGVDLTLAQPLFANHSRAFMGIIRVGAFDLTDQQAQEMLNADVKNADVVRPWVIARDIVNRPQNRWIIDFGTSRTETEAAQYAVPFSYVEKNVKPTRLQARSKKNREQWWLFEGRRSGMRTALKPLCRYLATPLVSKYRIWVWLPIETIPDARVIAFASDQDVWMGLLHASAHELWALGLGARHGVGNDPTYNLTSCYATYPFPWEPGSEPSEAENEHVRAIADSARELVAFRQKWLHPSDDEINVTISEKQLKKRTLTNLYNALTIYRDTPQMSEGAFTSATPTDLTLADIQELNDIHQELDRAVLSAYGWPHTLTDEQILEKLLALNLERAEKQKEA